MPDDAHLIRAILRHLSPAGQRQAEHERRGADTFGQSGNYQQRNKKNRQRQRRTRDSAEHSPPMPLRPTSSSTDQHTKHHAQQPDAKHQHQRRTYRPEQPAERIAAI